MTSLPTDRLLAWLRCPVSGLPLRRATAEELAAINQAIAGERLRNRGGDRILEPWTGAVLRSDGRWAFPLVGSAVQLMADLAVELAACPSPSEPRS